MKTTDQPAENRPPSSHQSGLELGDLPIRVRQADLARLLGLTRQRVSQMVADGWIPVTAGGRIDPSEAVRALIRRERQGAAIKVLPDLRDQIRDLEGREAAARSALADAHTRAADLERALAIAHATTACLARRAIDAEHALTLFAENHPDLDDEIDTTLIKAINTSLERIPADPELLPLARPCPPTEAQQADARALERERLSATAVETPDAKAAITP